MLWFTTYYLALLCDFQQRSVCSSNFTNLRQQQDAGLMHEGALSKCGIQYTVLYNKTVTLSCIPYPPAAVLILSQTSYAVELSFQRHTVHELSEKQTKCAFTSNLLTSRALKRKTFAQTYWQVHWKGLSQTAFFAGRYKYLLATFWYAGPHQVISILC